jgi:16S rRNA (adenine1518-N6/adenine1519-N6)-dimethyltransferase
VAVEVDRDLVRHLRDRYAGMPHVEIVEADVLTVALAGLAGDDFVLAGNVPYYITTPIIFHALEAPRPAVAVYLVQLEVAERIAAPPGDKIYGALSVNVQAVADAQLIRRVPPAAFNPPPTVDSAVVKLTPRAVPVIGVEHEARFRELCAGRVRVTAQAAHSCGAHDYGHGCRARGPGDRQLRSGSVGAAGGAHAR